MTEIEAFELIARKLHLDGVESLQGGNPCSEIVALLFYIENFLNAQGTPSALVSVLSNDLEPVNFDCIEMLKSMGCDCNGY